MFIATLIIAVVVALAAVFSVTFIPNKWARGIIVLFLVSGASNLFYQAGITSEFLSISAKYNRPLAFTFQHIAYSIKGEENEEVRKIASEMVILTYIAPRRWRDKSVEKITELTNK
jgi:hypothetical protein